MILTDTHTHLYYEKDSEKRSALMQRALETQVSRLFLPNVNSGSIPLVFGLVNEYPQHCFPMLGLHPCDVKEIASAEAKNYLDELDILKKTIAEHKIYAIGEVGIDLHWDKTTLEIQKKAFIIQIKWAKELGLPLVIHCREAFDDFFEIKYDQDGINELLFVSDMDIRQAINNLECIYYAFKELSVDSTYKMVDKPKPVYIEKIISDILSLLTKESI